MSVELGTTNFGTPGTLELRNMEPVSAKDFEGALGELEGIVKKLEDGDLTLESSLALYERGVELSRYCHARLEEAERRIEILNERGELKPAPQLGDVAK
jgi:exodeoxyribonuclease VII small subunit